MRYWDIFLKSTIDPDHEMCSSDGIWIWFYGNVTFADIPECPSIMQSKETLKPSELILTFTQTYSYCASTQFFRIGGCLYKMTFHLTLKNYKVYNSHRWRQKSTPIWIEDDCSFRFWWWFIWWRFSGVTKWVSLETFSFLCSKIKPTKIGCCWHAVCSGLESKY